MMSADTPPVAPVKLTLPLDPSEWHGNASETVWAVPVAPDLYRIDNTPFYFLGLSCGDIVRAITSADGTLTFGEIQARGGHSTYRLLPGERTPERFDRRWRALAGLGCRGERGPGRIFAVDVPPEVDIHATYALLEAGERAGTWEFEEGHCGHPLEPSH